MDDVTELELTPGTLIKGVYTLDTTGARKRVLEVLVGVLVRHPEVRDRESYTYVVDFREISNHVRWTIGPSFASRSTILQTTDKYDLLEHFLSSVYYRNSKFNRQFVHTYKNEFSTIYDITKRLHLPEIYAVLRLSK